MADETRLPFEIDDQVDDSLVTAYGGVPVLIEWYRASGAAEAVRQGVRVKARRRGLSESELVESFLTLWLSGGERCEDFGRLREDAALQALIGHEFPAAQTARDFLEGFDEAGLPLWQAGERARVPSESAAQQGLGRANGAVVSALQGRVVQETATLDVDATILESDKQAAQATYDGRRGYQPVFVLWAEQDVIVADEFRDGNVPAGSGNLRLVKRAVEALPKGVKAIRVRGDSALYETELLRWLEAQKIEYAISADMSRELSAAVRALPESAWSLEREEADALRQWAEVVFVPGEGEFHKDAPCLRRYLAIRILKKQGSLFSDGSDRRHFCVATNRAGEGLEILRWHRGKAGTIEHAHDVLTNELAAEALPSQKFGANAAWVRLNVLLYNLLSSFKRIALPGEFLKAKPKRLRFLLFNVVGKVVRHARETLLRLASEPARAFLARARLHIHLPQPKLAGV